MVSIRGETVSDFLIRQLYVKMVNYLIQYRNYGNITGHYDSIRYFLNYI